MSQTDDYLIPEIWTWDEESGGTFGSINRPLAGATFEKELPIGKHPLQLYSQGTKWRESNNSVRGVASGGIR